MIDFQDARLGPDTYDLVSLLRDSYVDLTERELDELIAYFLALKGTPAAAAEFRRRFDLMAVQRNLKALGTFGYQTTTRGNPVYIQYIPRTLRYVRMNLEKYPRFARLRTIARSRSWTSCDSARWIARARSASRRTSITASAADPRAPARNRRARDSRRVEVFATRTHFDYHNPAGIADLQQWLAEAGLELHSVHAPIGDAFRPDAGVRR